MNKSIKIRRCVACRERSEKSSFIRVVRRNTGEVFIDFTGKADGRGAYICKSPDCIKKAIKTGGINRSLRARVSSDTIEELRKMVDE